MLINPTDELSGFDVYVRPRQLFHCARWHPYSGIPLPLGRSPYNIMNTRVVFVGGQFLVPDGIRTPEYPDPQAEAPTTYEHTGGFCRGAIYCARWHPYPGMPVGPGPWN